MRLNQWFVCPLLAAGVHAAPDWPAPGLEVASGVQLKSHNFTLETLDRVHEAGFRTIRRGFYWDWIEKEKGVYDFSRYDREMARARELGLTVVGVFFNQNKLYEDDGLGGIQTEAGRRGFAAFAAALVAHYKDHEVVWEIWNEPNVRTFWRKNGMHNSREFAEEYTALVKETIPAILAVTPGARVLAGSLSNYWPPSYEWTEHCFQLGILQTGLAGWSVHPYGVKTPEAYAEGHGKMRALLRQYGAPELPLVNTERGFAIKETTEGWSGGTRAEALEFQAWHLVRQFLIDQLHGVYMSVWYEWDGDEFGLVDESNGARRPAYEAARTMMQHLRGHALRGRLPTDYAQDYLVEFTGSAGNRKLAAWTAPTPGSSPYDYTLHDLVLPVSGGAGTATDSKGRTYDLSGGTLTLPLSAEPFFLEIPAGLQLGKGVAGPAKEKPARPGAAPDEEIELNLFTPDRAWTFIKNTGEGSIRVDRDDHQMPIGILAYDFSASASKGTPYVLARTEVEIAQGAVELQLVARSPIAQQLTFRLVDSTGQTHQFKHKLAGRDARERITIPLTRRLEHWGGAADGTIHFPIKEILLSVPKPGPDHVRGEVEYSRFKVLRASTPAAP
ncbi:MAG TPA: cellulase family glycosylhydrolase [Kiritimatiellia bacterium]|nr:cellulase family glycosylhydrolase [Kiritimatiellia bacterium]